DQLSNLSLGEPLLAEFQACAANDGVCAVVGFSERAPRDLRLRAKRLSVFNHRLVEHRVIGDTAHGSDLNLECASLDFVARYADELLALGGERKRRMARDVARVATARFILV